MRRHVQSLSVAAAVLLVSGCGEPSRSPAGDAAVAVTVNAVGTLVASVAITVGAPDIESDLVFNVPLQGQTATGTLRIPPGTMRTISAVAYESAGTIAAEGSVTLATVERGWNPPVSIPMVSRAGHVPISIQIGPVSLAMSPATATLGPGDTLQLGVRITAASGDELLDAPEWATTDPTVLGVSSGGLVTALRAGQAEIVATYAGVAAVSRITVGATSPWAGVTQLGTGGNDFPAALALDAEGNVYVAGSTSGAFPGHASAGEIDAFVVKLDPAGEVAWIEQLGSAASDFAGGVAVDPQGNVWIAGITGGAFPGQASAGGYDAFVAKVDAATGGVSVRQFGTAGLDAADAATIDGLGNVWVSGIANGSAAFVDRLDAAGNVATHTELGGLPRLSCPGLAVDAAGNAWLAGDVDRSGSGTLPVVGAFVAKVSAGGAVEATELPHDVDFAYVGGLAVDALGGVYVVGVQETVAATWDAWIARLDASLAPAWPTRILAYAADAAAVALDPLGGVHVAGTALYCVDCPSDAFLATLDGYGDPVRPLDVLGTVGDELGRALALDAQGNAYVAGSTRGVFPGNVNEGGDDVFVAKLGPSGGLQ